MQEQKRASRRSRDEDELEQALKREGCPICLVTLKTMERVMDTWQYEGFSDVGNRHALIRSQGFCPRHTWQLTRLPAAFQLALVYRDILPEILAGVQRDLERNKTPRRSGRESFWNKLWRKWRQQPGHLHVEPHFFQCPLCQRQAEIEQHLITTLITMLPFEDLQAKLSQATGLCLPHLVQAYDEANNDVQRATLLECQSICLQRNLEEIKELLRKHDYRFLQEAQGDEMTAWRRSVELLVGNSGIR